MHVCLHRYWWPGVWLRLNEQKPWRLPFRLRWIPSRSVPLRCQHSVNIEKEIIIRKMIIYSSEGESGLTSESETYGLPVPSICFVLKKDQPHRGTCRRRITICGSKQPTMYPIRTELSYIEVAQLEELTPSCFSFQIWVFWHTRFVDCPTACFKVLQPTLWERVSMNWTTDILRDWLSYTERDDPNGQRRFRFVVAHSSWVEVCDNNNTTIVGALCWG